MQWITRECTKINRIDCPWLIVRRYLQKEPFHAD